MKKIWQQLGARLRTVSLVDRVLFIFLFLLFGYMACRLLVDPSGETHTTDIVVRTSASAIFGYLISGPFTQQATLSTKRAHYRFRPLLPPAPAQTRYKTALGSRRRRPTAAKPVLTFPQKRRLFCIQTGTGCRLWPFPSWDSSLLPCWYWPVFARIILWNWPLRCRSCGILFRLPLVF